MNNFDLSCDFKYSFSNQEIISRNLTNNNEKKLFGVST